MNRISSLKARMSKKPWITIWLINLLIAVISLCLINLFHIKTEVPGLSHSLITGLFGQYLAVLGMLTAVAVAVMSWIYTQGINCRQKGFSDLRNGTSKLNMNVVEMLQNLQRTSQAHQVLLHNWATAIGKAVVRLNEITPGWKGWKESNDLEKILKECGDTALSTLRKTGSFLSTDLVWTKIFANNDTYNRDILIGLYWLSIGAMATNTSTKLFQFFISIIVLLISGVIVSIAEIVWGNRTNDIDLVLILVFTLLLISHVIWLAQIITSWWQEQRSQEKYWESH